LFEKVAINQVKKSKSIVMFSPNYLLNNNQHVFEFPLTGIEKTGDGSRPVFYGKLLIHIQKDGTSYKLLGVYFGDKEVTGLITYLEKNSGTPLFPQIQAAIENHLQFIKDQAEPVSDDHTMNLQNEQPCLNS
jgi:hypothetical protein